MASKACSTAASPGPVGLSAHRTSSATCSGTVPCRLTWDAAPGIEVTSTAQSEGARPLRSLTSATRSGTPARSPGGFAPGSAAPGIAGAGLACDPFLSPKLGRGPIGGASSLAQCSVRSSSSYSDSEYGSPLRSILALPRSHVGAASSSSRAAVPG